MPASLQMDALVTEINEMEDIIETWLATEVRRVDTWMRELTIKQLLFARKTLTKAHIAGQLAENHLQFLEDVLETWRLHPLATKMAVVNQVQDLSESGSWPDDPSEGT